ncbi:MAG: hypothetical protein R3359_01060 [Marinirhabdus sp.]|nr:hypothetical protein [Marinirhabdus sp.]
MGVLSSVFKFYINASIHVAFAVTAMAAVTVLEFDLDLPFAVWLFIFFGSVTGYNFVKYAKVAGLHHRSLAQSLRAIQVFSGLCGMVLLFSVFFVPLEVLFTAAGFGLLTLFYAVPLMKQKNLRSFAGMKILIVALVWAGASVMIPVAADGRGLDTEVAITFFQRTLLVLVLIIPFEIRDLRYDRPILRTLPQQMGVKKTKVLGFVLLLVVLFLEVWKEYVSVVEFMSLICMVLLCSAAILVSKKKPRAYFASFWVEGIPLVWCGLWLLLRHFLT